MFLIFVQFSVINVVERMSSRFLREILNKPRLPSRDIPQYIRDRATGTLGNGQQKPALVWLYKKNQIRKRFATFGKSSGLKPGICWPSRDELEYMKQFDQTFEKSIQTMQENLLQTKKAEQEKRLKREKQIVANLKKLPKMKEEFWQNYHNLYSEIEEEKTKKTKLIQDVREYLGYDIEPNDPRFEEALAKKDEEAKIAMRAARKLEKQRQHMEMLQALVSEALEKEKSTTNKATEDRTKSE
ncbi:growth arrest and DNA damage-inducible proteins-interacting protein CRIF [Dermatophagoides pteronyssinus]|uniref:growth arrest and DNA damage-inducible proteins-interacting protein CRIF n=1 Tax=Dermatophagoides pteronyssinus TaxID=6956 RepID=UPI003F66CB11